MAYLVHVNDYSHRVDDALGDVESRILDAVRVGGAFVDFGGEGERTVRVLVTPASRVRIERLPEPMESPDADEGDGDVAFIDFEF